MRALGAGVGEVVTALTVYNGEIVAAGFFLEAGGNPALAMEAGGVPTPQIARWDGASWSGMDGLVNALTTYGGSLIAGGNFQNAGGTPSMRIARWVEATGVVDGLQPPSRRWRIDATPNPFTEQISIRFEMTGIGPLPAAMIYDVQGRHVRSLAVQFSANGTGRMLWDGLDDRGQKTPAGIYFLRVATPAGSVETKVVRLN